MSSNRMGLGSRQDDGLAITASRNSAAGSSRALHVTTVGLTTLFALTTCRPLEGGSGAASDSDVAAAQSALGGACAWDPGFGVEACDRLGDRGPKGVPRADAGSLERAWPSIAGAADASGVRLGAPIAH